jgi:pimeloyl-ACP methyl ester carboxylesterase
MPTSIYYLPGHGGELRQGLGQGLMDRGFNPVGRETRGEFRALRFQEQVEIVRKDLETDFWSPDAMVVANSYGGYLFLHAQSGMKPYVGRVLLLSPIIGDFSDGAKMGFSPPMPYHLRDLVASGGMPKPHNCEIHVGSEDWQSDPLVVREFGRRLGVPVTVAGGLGHMLGKGYVGRVLDRWLEQHIGDYGEVKS